MGNRVAIPNIDPEMVEKTNLNKNNEEHKESSFNTKNYLNVRLDKENGEVEKTLTIRLLPMNLETGYPFVKAHFHNLHVNKAIFNTEWKSYVCLAKNEDIDHERFGSECPLCKMNSQAYKLSEKETDPVKKKELQKLSCSYKSNECVIVRCIERGKEDEGVKFWKFNIREDKADPYNQIMDLFKRRREKSNENILDLYEGRDIVVTIKSTKDSNSNNVTLRLDEDITPLTNDEELLKNWVYDKKTWQEVFPPKDYDYISLVIEGKYPWFDNVKKKWVDREEFNKNKKNQVAEEEKKADDADKQLREESEPEKYTEKSDFEKTVVVEDEGDGDELPF